MLRKRRLLIGSVLAIIFICSCAYLTPAMISDLFDRWCDQDDTLAQLYAGTGRLIIISAERCWEVGRGIHYEVREQDVVISPESLIDTDSGERHHYTTVYAENETLVGVLDTTVTPPKIVVIYDFKSRDTWPRARDDESSYGDAYEQQSRDLFSRLKLENPELVIPPYYQ